MLCIFRVAASNLDVDAILRATKIRPFRIDRAEIDAARMDALHYDVTPHDVRTQAELISIITTFLHQNANDISQIRQNASAEHFTLDISLVVEPEMASLTLELNAALLAATAQLGLSYTISVYKG